MQVAQYIRQPIRQRRKVKRRLTVEFNPSQSDLLARDGFEHRDRGRMISPFIGQPWIEAFDLFALALQAARDLHFDQALDAHSYRQQVSQPRDLIVVTYKDRINPDWFALEPVVIALPTPIGAILIHASLHRDLFRRVAQLHAPTQSASGLGDRLLVAFDTLDHVTSLDDLAPRAVSTGAPAPDQSRLLLLFNFPLDLQQPCDFVPLYHCRKRGFEALFIAVLMSATPRLRRQRVDLCVCPLQPVLKRFRLCCSQVLGLNHLQTLAEIKSHHLPLRAGRDLSCALAYQFVASSDQFAILFAKRDQSLRAAQSRINPSGERLLN